MRRPLVLTGGPAVGKSTCGRILAEGCPRAAFIDADDIRQLVVAGASTLWRDAEGERQFLLAAQNTAALAANLHADGFDVAIADFVTAASLDVYRRALPGCLVVALDLRLAEARERASTREVWLTEEEFVLLHEWAGRPLDTDHRVDVSGMTIEEQVDRLAGLWTGAEHPQEVRRRDHERAPEASAAAGHASERSATCDVGVHTYPDHPVARAPTTFST